MWKRNSWFLVSAILMALDMALLAVLFLLAFEVRNALAPWIGYAVQWEAALPLARVGILLTVAVFSLYNLYPGYGLTGIKELERASKALAILFLALSGTFYLNKPFQRFPRSILILTWGMAWWVLPVGRALLRNWLSRFSWYGAPTVVFGHAPWAREVAGTLQWSPRIGWRVCAVLPLEAVAQENVSARQAPIAVLVLSPAEEPAPYARLLAQRYRRVVLVQNYAYFGSLWVEARDLSGKLGLEFHYHLLRPFSRWLKRTVDIVGSTILLIGLSPLLLLLALLIKLDSPGPILFRQKRLGKDFRPFEVLKFRTMVVDAEARLQEILARDPAARAQYEKYHKLESDPRITRVGRWLRKFSLDELPQLLNVLRGEMSLVGPRAYMPSELEAMGSYAEIILRVHPGMTGWWQVQGRHRTTFQQRLQMDEYYISNWSLWMDIFILLKTVWVVISGQGG